MYLTETLIHTADFLAPAGDFQSGGCVVFTGIVRNHSAGKKVLYLDYEAYAPMAESEIAGLVEEAHARWPLEEIRLLHRVGRVNLGEAAVAIAVFSAHRAEAYEASRFLIDEIKHRVPIWKKEYFEDGTSEWSLCAHERHAER